MKYRAEFHIMWVRTDVEADSEEEAIKKIEDHVYGEMEKGAGRGWSDGGEIQDITVEEEA